MDHIIIHLTDPRTGRDVARDVTGLSRARLDRYRRVAESAEFRELEAQIPDPDPARLLAAWVERVGPVRAGVAILRRRASWVRVGAALGLLLGAFAIGWMVGMAYWLPKFVGSGSGNIIDLLRAYLRASPQLTGTIVTWLTLLVFFALPIVLGVLLGAGAGWFAAALIDAWEHARARRRAR
jgi:hypothetical protein